MTNFALIPSKMAASWPLNFFFIISEILHDSWSINFCFLILHIPPGKFWWHFDSHIINPLITRATDKEILVSAFQEKVFSRSSFYLANMHSNVSQWPDLLLGANDFKMAVKQPFWIWVFLWYSETSLFRHYLFPRNVTELRIWQSNGAAAPPPSKQCWSRGYIYNSHCNIVILVGLHVLVVHTKYNINVIKI